MYEDAEVVAVLGGGELKVAFTADQSSTPDSQQDARTQPTPSGVAADTYDGHGTAKPVVVQQRHIALHPSAIVVMQSQSRLNRNV